MADLKDVETTEMQGSGAKPYTLKNVGGVYSCSYPAWINQSAPIERRTCKHLRKLRGEEAEKERLGGELPARAKPSGAKKDAPPVLLAQTWDNFIDLDGWWISEKLDGFALIGMVKNSFRASAISIMHRIGLLRDYRTNLSMVNSGWIARRFNEPSVS